MWIGVDDTDSPDGGCTTWVLSQIVRVARRFEIDLIGAPRLVRLNPNIPWKTRGNGALAARFGHGTGPSSTLGAIDGAPVLSFRNGREPAPAREAAFTEAAWSAVLAASPRADGTDPAMVVTRRRPPAAWYWDAVRDVVTVERARRLLRTLGAHCRVRGEERGLIGASAAIAWPARRHSWELIGYRAPDRWGTRRSVDARSVIRAQQREPALFLCHDPGTRRLLVSPHTDCPILFGLRASEPGAPVRALGGIDSERVDRWLLFRTNQGTGDHLLPRTAHELRPFSGGVVRGTVAAAPSVGAGGHARFRLADRRGDELDCIAFEPTKTLPSVVQRLVAGDSVVVWGSRAESPELRLEGIRVVALRRLFERSPPRCPACRRSTSSLGRGRGYRCPGCRRRFPPESVRTRAVARRLRIGTYHPTPSARRHLAPRGPEPGLLPR